jgi:hypothetical protein
LSLRFARPPEQVDDVAPLVRPATRKEPRENDSLLAGITEEHALCALFADPV